MISGTKFIYKLNKKTIVDNNITESYLKLSTKKNTNVTNDGDAGKLSPQYILHYTYQQHKTSHLPCVLEEVLHGDEQLLIIKGIYKLEHDH